MSDVAKDIIGYMDLMRLYGATMSIEYLQDTAESFDKRMTEARNAILSLSDLKVQSVLWMHYITFYSIHRIKRETGYSKRTIYRYIRRGLDEIRVMYGAETTERGADPLERGPAAADQGGAGLPESTRKPGHYEQH